MLDDELSIDKPGYESKVYKRPNLVKQIDGQLLSEYQVKTDKFPELYVPPARHNRVIKGKVFESITLEGATNKQK